MKQKKQQQPDSPPLNSNQLLAIQQLIVDPLKDHISDEISKAILPLATRVENVELVEPRVQKLESLQGKALVGFAVYSTILAGALAGLWTWFKSKIHFG
jgi:hypothetical protein